MDNTKTEIISGAMRVLSTEIQTQDGVANAACRQAADRLDQQDKDLQTLYYRLAGVDEKTCSPETLEVLERLKPIYHPKNKED